MTRRRHLFPAGLLAETTNFMTTPYYYYYYYY
jgi:hypothetical protein